MYVPSFQFNGYWIEKKFRNIRLITKSGRISYRKFIVNIRLETKFCRILPLTYCKKYDMT